MSKRAEKMRHYWIEGVLMLLEAYWEIAATSAFVHADRKGRSLNSGVIPLSQNG